MPSQERLNQLFTYDPDTGKLFWKLAPTSGSTKKGDEAGWVQRSPHRTRRDIEIKGKCLRVHRVIWTMIYGPIPEGKEIDHIDHNALNNRLDNLRLVDHRTNNRNMKLFVTSTTGHLGISFHKRDRVWQARIASKHIGQYKTLEEAIAAREKALSDQNFHPNHGKNLGAAA